MTISYFNPHSKNPKRAVQMWQILVGKAMNRQTITYECLSSLMYPKPSAGVLSKILGHIAFYCKDHALAQLNVIVVEKTSGKPGSKIPLEAENIEAERERVYERDWYDIVPPNEKDFAEAVSPERRAARQSKL
jgi:hypothetical protein